MWDTSLLPSISFQQKQKISEDKQIRDPFQSTVTQGFANMHVVTFMFTIRESESLPKRLQPRAIPFLFSLRINKRKHEG